MHTSIKKVTLSTTAHRSAALAPQTRLVQHEQTASQQLTHQTATTPMSTPSTTTARGANNEVAGETAATTTADSRQPFPHLRRARDAPLRDPVRGAHQTLQQTPIVNKRNTQSAGYTTVIRIRRFAKDPGVPPITKRRHAWHLPATHMPGRETDGGDAADRRRPPIIKQRPPLHPGPCKQT